MRRDFRRIVYHFTPKPEAGEMERRRASLTAQRCERRTKDSQKV
jgi:hypothetical protein